MPPLDGPRRLVRLQSVDGRTTSYDFGDSEAARALLERLRREPKTITAITMVNGANAVFVKPRGFSNFKMFIESFSEGKGGERFEIQADDVRLTATSHAEAPSFRIFLDRTGRRQFDPRDRIVKR